MNIDEYNRIRKKVMGFPNDSSEFVDTIIKCYQIEVLERIEMYLQDILVKIGELR